MKKITVAKNQQIIFGHIVPTGAVYGKFSFSYNRRVVTGYEFVTDKNNRRVFNKNGTPKMRAVVKEVPTKNTVTYSVESFIDYSFKGDKHRHLYAWVLFDGGKKWQEIALGGTPVTQELEKMVRDFIKEHTLCEPKIAHVKTKNTRTLAPKFRQANQFDNVFRMRPENVHDINENVKPRSAIIHTNMDKLHPIDNKPIYHSKDRPYKSTRNDGDQSSKVLSCRIYHNDNTVTTII